jgi:YD repeat-containing protein
MYLRDSSGNVRGRIEENSTSKYVYDEHGRLLATYNKSVNLTISASGGQTLKEDQLQSFLPNKK